ncbi:MAG: hypothetical protein H6696_06695 [Deferribacteres bacterium]|nr:hypothetical protein [Deferribacteres bacterium]
MSRQAGFALHGRNPDVLTCIVKISNQNDRGQTMNHLKVAPTGHSVIAQGNALGKGHIIFTSPEGAQSHAAISPFGAYKPYFEVIE